MKNKMNLWFRAANLTGLSQLNVFQLYKQVKDDTQRPEVDGSTNTRCAMNCSAYTCVLYTRVTYFVTCYFL